MRDSRQRRLRDEAGQELVEYGLILALVVLASAALMSQSGNSISTIWTMSSAAFGGTTGPAVGGNVATSHSDNNHDDH